MTTASVVLAGRPGAAGSRRAPGRPGGRRPRPGERFAPLLAAAGSLDEVVVVIDEASLAAGLPEGLTVLLDEAESPSEASALRAALDWSGRAGHRAAVVAVCPLAGTAAVPAGLTDPALWAAVAAAPGGPVVAAPGAPAAGPVRLDDEVWPLLPLAGEIAALWRARPELVSPLSPGRRPPPESDRRAVERLLGRRPEGAFQVVVRAGDGSPLVIENAPFLADGTPMPTRYWLVGRRERDAVSRLESGGGAAAAAGALPAEVVAAAHAAYAAGREATIPADHRGPRPSGGVGGTARGVKCLHAHLAAYLAGTGDPVGRWTALQLRGELRGPVAAVDCGTNSTRLLVAAPDGRQLERRMTITRLGEGLAGDGALAPAAIERTLRALSEYRRAMDAHGVVDLRAVATAAARAAPNAAELTGPAEELLGVPLEVLGSGEEGALAFSGATADLDPASGPFLVVDLGGGSTELVTTEGDELVVVSLPIGCVRLTEAHLGDDPPTGGQLAAARAAADRLVAGALAGEPRLSGRRRVVGVAGTVTTLAALSLGLDSHDPARTHHHELGRAEVERLAAELAAEPLAARRRHPGLEADRADVIVGGAIVLAAVLAGLGAESCTVSEHDSLDALAAGLLAG